VGGQPGAAAAQPSSSVRHLHQQPTRLAANACHESLSWFLPLAALLPPAGTGSILTAPARGAQGTPSSDVLLPLLPTRSRRGEDVQVRAVGHDQRAAAEGQVARRDAVRERR